LKNQFSEAFRCCSRSERKFFRLHNPQRKQAHDHYEGDHEYPKELLDKFMAENGFDGPECFTVILSLSGDEHIMAEPKILRQ
jgi:hypothetical protein